MKYITSLLHVLFPLFIAIWIPTSFLFASELDSLRSIVDTIPSSQRAGIYNRMFVLNGSFLVNDSSKVYAEQALKYAISTRDTFNMAFAHRNLGFYLNSVHNTQDAIKHYRLSLELLKSYVDLRRTFVIYNELSDILIGSRQYDKASTLLYEAMQFADQNNYTIGKIGTHRNLGTLYRQLNEPEKAKKQILQAIEETEKQNEINPREQSSLYRTLGLINYDLDNLDKAMEHFQHSLKLMENISDARLSMMLHNSIALVYTRKNQAKQALEHYKKALHFAEASKNQNLITAALLNTGLQYISLGKHSEAEKYLQRGLVIADEYGFVKWQRNAHLYLYQNYKVTGDFENALNHQLDYQYFEDSLKIEENKLKIAELETIYETDKKEKQIDLLNKENEIKSLKLKKNRSLIITLAIISLIILLSTINYIRLTRQKEKDNAIIEKQALEKKLLSTVISTEDKERKRFAADLHDGLGPLLSSVKLYLSGLDGAPENKKPEMISTASDLIDQSIQTTRTISNNILPVELSETGLVASIREFCDKIRMTRKLNINVHDQTGGFRLEPSTEIILYRIVQELINNTIKHADANGIEISFLKEEKQFHIEYTDDGKGFEVEKIMDKPHEGMGLSNIMDRIRSLGGKVEFSSGENEGLSVFIILAIPEF